MARKVLASRQQQQADSYVWSVPEGICSGRYRLDAAAAPERPSVRAAADLGRRAVQRFDWRSALSVAPCTKALVVREHHDDDRQLHRTHDFARWVSRRFGLGRRAAVYQRRLRDRCEQRHVPRRLHAISRRDADVRPPGARELGAEAHDSGLSGVLTTRRRVNGGVSLLVIHGVYGPASFIGCHRRL